jgi:hypothetical protein
MTHLVDDNLNHLSEEHKELLEEFNQGWTRHQKQPNQVQRHAMVLDVKELYTRSGLNTPVVIVCDSIFQLTVYPIIIGLMLDENSREQALPILRRSLQMPPWARLWQNLDSQLHDSQLKTLGVKSDKNRQQNSQKELNRQIHRIYENVGGTVDTHDAPRLTPIGLQINSNFHAAVKSLLASLKKDVNGWVSDQAMERANQRHEQITTMFARMESQLDLQLLPQIVARSINTFKTILSAEEGRLGNVRRDSTAAPTGERSEILALIKQSKGEDESDNPGRPIGNALWSPARMGAYRDPAIRLLSSGLQLELFKKSQLMQSFPLHFFLRDIAQDAYSAPNLESLNIWSRLLERAYALLFYEGIAFVCEYPVHSRLDPEHRFHDENGAALRFGDDFQAHFWHGRRVSRDIIEEPGSITVDRIERERNVETRSILIERYGLERFLKDSGAVKLSEDECGVLYRKVFTSSDSMTDEPLVVVMVNNSTPEPDGSSKQYFLRVPPAVRSAREGVAWTFGLTEDEYAPEVES